jgi:translocation and assembly module TamB
LALQDQQIKKLALALQVDLQDKVPSDIELNAEGVSAGGQKVKTASLTAKGKLSEHSVAADVQTVEQHLQLQLDGRLEGKQWQGKLNRADIQDKNAGRWGLQKPVGIKAVLGGETTGEAASPPVHPSVAVEEGCWESTTPDTKQKRDARLCLAGQWEQEIGWQAKAAAQKIPLALFKPFFPPDLNLSGTIDADGNGKSENGQLQAAAKLIPSPGTLFYRPADGEQIEVGYREGLFQAALNEGRLQTTVRLTLVGQGSIQADVGLSPLTPGEDLGKSRLEGKVDLRLTQLGLLSALTPMIEESNGRIDLQAALGGTVNQPEIKGEATLTQGSAVVPSLGIHVTELQLTLQSNGDGTLAIRGGAKSGPGTLQIGGSVTLDAKQGWPMQLTFKGDRFQILDTHEAKVLASPDLKLQIQKPRISLTGEILIPDASLTLRELPKGAVKVSDDTVIIHDDASGKGGKTDGKKAAAWEISSDVMIRLGEKVTFSGFGLTARITGNLRAIDQPGKLTLGEGQLQILDGQYRAYGQKLDIADGRLIFGGPINNPGLDIRATRKAEKEAVTAGILVRGTLQKPETTVFSDPPMDQAEALSYLLLGRPLNQASSGEGDFLTKAISALGLKGGDFLAKKIGRKLGLDEVKVEAGENAEQATLVVGRYFSPKFYVSYGIGLFESINTLHIRYKINRKLTLQGESGTESGMDLIYTKEYN